MLAKRTTKLLSRCVILLLTTFWNIASGYIRSTEKASNFGAQIIQFGEKLETFNTLVYRLETVEKIIDNHENDIKALNNILIESITELNATQNAILKQLDRYGSNILLNDWRK